ncbi:alkyl/aryl-sulfatase [Microbulbifer litoralis]|uniref:alkyl/aryl-sulfatase n=1 Tax=Microbulbifer litoralis TaxID=2933965 RepID=UPI0020279D9A|nr:alkyl sulfatase dimerization domain-containing protein [Microbulbifer sp. GX H0434]
MAVTMDFSDRQDFVDANRGLIAATPDLVVKAENGKTVWDMQVYRNFLKEEAPDTVNPSLWRQALLNSKTGLYEVVDGIYQVRGFDLTTMSVIRGKTGWIIIDPLTMTEVSQAALELVNRELGERPVSAVIYTHSHPDHFGGVKGVISQQDVDSGKTRVIAPAHFMEHVASEMALAGNAMSRRAQYMHGVLLPRGPRQQVDNGLGKGVAIGTFTLIEPTEYITHTDQSMDIDGVRFEFQLTPEAEADTEIMMYLPQFKALMGAENLNAAMHNILTPRGAKVRDPLNWSKSLDETLALFGDRIEVVFTSHYWPRWGKENVKNYIAKQRDMLKYLHDQTLRLINQGYKMDEIAERVKLPESLGSEWFNRGYYGNVTHNVKGVYQRYMGFWSGNPANLHPLPPHELGTQYVDAFGGSKVILEKTREAYGRGDYRWAATLLNHLVMAEPENTEARMLQADIFEQLGYQTENGPWRNIYLSGALELRNGIDTSNSPTTASPDLLRALSIEQIFDILAVRLNGPKADGVQLAIEWQFTDPNKRYAMTLEHSVLRHRAVTGDVEADLAITLDRNALNRLLVQPGSLAAQVDGGAIQLSGDPKTLAKLFSLLDSFSADFNVVTPAKGVIEPVNIAEG